MRRQALATAAGLASWVVPAPGVAGADAIHVEPVRRIAAGSCHRTGPNSGPAFATIANTKPCVFLFLGDNIYGDTRDMAELAGKYRALGELPGWQRLRGESTVLPLWDDHDYGENDAGEEYPAKRESSLLFKDFFGFAPDHPARGREGIYHSAMAGPPERRVQFLLLDTRYFRSPLKQERIDGRKTYIPDPDPGKTMLGAAQWAWLEQQLAEPAAVRVIASGIQILPEEHRFEKWANLPAERARLLALAGKATGKIVLASGDRHMAEISKLEQNGTTLVELTTSGMTHAGGGRGESNRHRVGNLYSDKNSGRIDIDWEKPGGPGLSVTILDANGIAVENHAW